MEQKKKSPIGIVNMLKRQKAKQIVLTIIQAKEVVGLDEIIQRMGQRPHTIQVCSEKCEYLFVSAKNFKDKFYNNSLIMKKQLSSRGGYH